MTQTTKKLKGGTLFSGGGGFCLGMVAAGVDHAWGVEYDDRIAQVARDNGLNTITADILQCDPSTFEPVDFLHASPPCPNFSNAKTNAEETENDAALAAKVCEFIVELLPDIFTLENVYGYRKSKSWQTIARTLLEHGYQFNYWHVNMANYGVPQTRKRMIAIARRDGITPMLPPATHAETAVNDLFGSKRKWVGWYEAIEDLIPTLPESEFAPWQLERLPEDFKNLLVHGTNSNGITTNRPDAPAAVVLATLGSKAAIPRAFIAPGGNANSNGRVVKMTVRALARFQGFPDFYKFPLEESIKRIKRRIKEYKICGQPLPSTFSKWVKEQVESDAGTVTTIIGNAVPPLFAQRLVEWLI